MKLSRIEAIQVGTDSHFSLLSQAGGKVNKKELINHLEAAANVELPDKFYQLKKEDLAELVRYTDDVISFQNAGLDKLFESMSLTIKYIPNFVLISIVKKFLEAPLAARITRKLTLKQAVSLGNGLSAAYLTEVSIYQDTKLSAAIIAKLKPSHATAILQQLCLVGPLKMLDMYPWLTPEFQQVVEDSLDLNTIDASALHSEAHMQTWQQLRSRQSGTER